MTENVMSYCIRKRTEPIVFLQELYIVGREWMVYNVVGTKLLIKICKKNQQ